MEERNCTLEIKITNLTDEEHDELKKAIDDICTKMFGEGEIIVEEYDV